MNERRWLTLIGALVVMAAFASGWPGLDNAFINFDDPDVIVNNERLDDPGIVDAVDVFGEIRDHAYLPFYYLALMPDAAAGHKGPWGFHLGSLIWHAAGGVLVLAFFFALTGALIPSAAAALVFVCHPVLVESVAWASGRKDQVSLVFLLGGLLCWTRWLKGGGRGAFIGAASLMFLGCFAKGTVVVFPALALLVAFHLKARKVLGDGVRFGRGSAVLMALAVVPIVVHLWIAAQEGTAGAGATHGAIDGVMLFLAAAGGYVQHLLIPVSLSIHYHLPAGMPFGMQHVLGLAALLAMAFALAQVLRGRGGLVALALAWMLVALAPFNNVFPRTSVPMADRYLAVVVPGFGLLVGALIGRFPGRVAAPVLGLLVLLAGWLTHDRTPEFKNGATVWARAMTLQPEDPVPPLMVAEAMLAEGRGTDDRVSVLEHMRSSVGLAVKTGDPVVIMRSRLRLADTLLRSGRWEDAEEAFKLIRRNYAGSPERFASLGVDPVVLEHNHAQCLIGRGMPKIGRAMLVALLDRVPGHPPSRLAIAGLYVREGFEELGRVKDETLRDLARIKVVKGLTGLQGLVDDFAAGKHAEHRLAIEPEALKQLGDATLAADWRPNRFWNANACVDALLARYQTEAHGYSLRASVNVAMDGKEAPGVLADLQRAYFYDPEDPKACVRLCRHYMAIGRNKAARTHLEYMHRVRPDDETIKIALAELYLAQGRTHHNEGRGDFALLAAEAAKVLVPDGIDIWVLLGQIHENAGRWAKADGCYRKALTLDGDHREARLGVARHHQYKGLQTLAGIRAVVASAPVEERAAVEATERKKVLADYRNALSYAAGARDVEMARRYLKEHREKGGDRSRELRVRGQREMSAGDLEVGVALLRQAVAIDGLDVEAWWMLGMAIRARSTNAKDATARAEERNEALRCIEQALSLDPEHLPSLRMACDLYFVKGAWPELRRVCRRFLVLSKDIAELVEDRRVVRSRLARAEEG